MTAAKTRANLVGKQRAKTRPWYCLACHLPGLAQLANRVPGPDRWRATCCGWGGEALPRWSQLMVSNARGGAGSNRLARRLYTADSSPTATVVESMPFGQPGVQCDASARAANTRRCATPTGSIPANSAARLPAMGRAADTSRWAWLCGRERSGGCKDLASAFHRADLGSLGALLANRGGIDERSSPLRHNLA